MNEHTIRPPLNRSPRQRIHIHFARCRFEGRRDITIRVTYPLSAPLASVQRGLDAAVKEVSRLNGYGWFKLDFDAQGKVVKAECFVGTHPAGAVSKAVTP